VIIELNIPSYRAEQAKKTKQGRAVGGVAGRDEQLSLDTLVR
jgi:hypothetical protein